MKDLKAVVFKFWFLLGIFWAVAPVASADGEEWIRCNCACIGYDGYGGNCYAGYGGPLNAGYGGACYAGYGGPMYDGYGGPLFSGYLCWLWRPLLHGVWGDW